MVRTLIVLVLFIVTKLPAQIEPTALTCEYLTNPTVIDEPQPRLSWINRAPDTVRNQYQTAYEIRVASHPDLMNNADVWKSGKIKSDQNSRIKYTGKKLSSRTTYYWQVRVWDKNLKPSEWSVINQWHTGLLEVSEWKASWIGAPWQGEEFIPTPPGGPQNRTKILPPPAPLLRKTITLNKSIKSAKAYTTGLGYFELYANGQKVSDDVLVPNQTNYDRRPHLVNAGISLPDSFAAYQVMYLAYDLTPYLRTGQNVIGAILGNGFYNAPKFWTASYGSPRFIAQIHIEYTDGSEDVIVSDTTWKAHRSAILSDLVYDGEIYDARHEIKDWCMPHYDDSAWPRVILRKAPYGKMTAHTALADKVTKVLQPIKFERKNNGVLKIDFEEEISGWVRLKNIKGPEGHQVKINFISNAFSGENVYTFNGFLSEYAPRFNWFVFSSIEIENWPGEFTAEQIQAEAVNTDLKVNAHFETSNQLLNNINKIWRRSQLDNTHGGIASDCPHRERSGYTGDAQVVCQTVMENFDTRSFYTKWLKDMRSAQTPSTGYVPNGAPWQPGCGGGVAWGAAIHIIPWEFYLHTGDKDVLLENYEAMKGYIRYMQTWVDKNGIMYSQRQGKDGKPLKWWNLGEWAGLDSMPPDPLVHTFYLWICADITAKTSKLLSKTKETVYYSTLAAHTKQVFLSTFYHDSLGEFGKYGANIFALKMGVRPDQYKSVLTKLKNTISLDNGHFDTGIFGTRYFFDVLTEHGMHDLAYAAINKTDFPSFGYWLASGSTTTREQWDNSGSHNHPMFGGCLTWMYHHLAGMKPDDQYPGYKRIHFHPKPVGDLQYAEYSQETNRGLAGIKWQLKDVYSMDITVPVGSTGVVYLPMKYGKTITSNNKSLAIQKIKVLKITTDHTIIQVGSGKWHFEIKI